MVEMYVKLVIAGKRTCNTQNTKVVQVPEEHRQAVLDRLTAMGRDADGQCI